MPLAQEQLDKVLPGHPKIPRCMRSYLHLLMACRHHYRSRRKVQDSTPGRKATYQKRKNQSTCMFVVHGSTVKSHSGYRTQHPKLCLGTSISQDMRLFGGANLPPINRFVDIALCLEYARSGRVHDSRGGNATGCTRTPYVFPWLDIPRPLTYMSIWCLGVNNQWGFSWAGRKYRSGNKP